MENFYLIFKVSPFHKNIARSILKEPKYYFYDTARIKDHGARIENLVACSLLKNYTLLKIPIGFTCKLHYLRTKDGKELDFLICVDDNPVLCIEVKSSDKKPNKFFAHFKKYIFLIECIQLVAGLKKEFDTVDNIKVRNLENFLSDFDWLNYIKRTMNIK